MKHFKCLYLLLFFSVLSALSYGQKYTGLTAVASDASNTQAMFDNNYGSRWSGPNNVPATSFVVDLGSIKDVNSIKIYWEAANAKDYDLSFSSDNSSFTDVIHKTGMPAGSRTDLISGLTESCRYIKFQGITLQIGYGYSIWEFEVYPPVTPVLTSLAVSPTSSTIAFGGTKQFSVGGLDQIGNSFALTNTTIWSVDGTGASIDANGLFSTTHQGFYTITATNSGISKTATIEVLPLNPNLAIAPGVSATASSPATGSVAAFAFDNNGGTRWESEVSDPQWIRIDLGAKKDITDMIINWEGASAKDYIIEASTDNVHWSTAVTKTNMANGARIDRIYDVNFLARYVRLTGTARTSIYAYSIWEFQIFGKAADNFRSKASGNWNDSNTWESCTDNVSWVGATSCPNSITGTVTVQPDHVITITENTTASAINISPRGKLTLLAGKTLSGTEINLASDATGTATYVDNGTTNMGLATVQQYLTCNRNWYISSPVANASSIVFTPSANSLWSYDELNSGGVLWDPITANDITLDPMKGYVANLTTDGAISFTGGTLNTGNKSILLNRTENGQGNRGFNLVGNPYPSYLDWVAASGNSSNLGTTIWYRTKPSGYVFATYNASGNVSANGATQYIPPMQAFWVCVQDAGGANTTGTLAVTNDMRSHDTGTNAFKAPATKTTPQQLVRLQVSDGTNKDEAVVYFDTKASNGIDAYDSPKMSNGNSAPDIYTVISNQNLAINGLNSLTGNQELSLGFKTNVPNSFSIKATEWNNFNANTRIVLKDKLLNTEQELTNGSSYSFTSDSTTTASRFSIIFKTNSNVTGIANETADNRLSVYKNANGQLIVTCVAEMAGHGSTVSVYNAFGELLENKPVTNTSTVLSKTYIAGVYLVSIHATDKAITQKIVIR